MEMIHMNDINDLENTSKEELFDEIESLKDEINSLKDEKTKAKSNLTL